MKLTPFANSTEIRLPSNSRPSKAYLASSASRGSLNSYCKGWEYGKEKLMFYKLHVILIEGSTPYTLYTNIIMEKRSEEVHTTKAKSRFISTLRTLRKRGPKTIRPSSQKYRRVDTSPLKDQLNTTFEIVAISIIKSRNNIIKRIAKVPYTLCKNSDQIHQGQPLTTGLRVG